MLLIECQWCGPRSQTEFDYVGPVMTRPDSQAPMAAWIAFAYERDNTKGEYDEIWQHCGGCRAFVTVRRNTITNEMVTVKSRMSG